MDRAEVIEYWKGLHKTFSSQLEKEENHFGRMHLQTTLDVLDTTIAALREQEQSQWISIKERPPIDETKDYQEKWEEDPEFLVMIKDGVEPTCLYFNGVNWYENDGEPFTYNVTHWMPLPEPPKGD